MDMTPYPLFNNKGKMQIRCIHNVLKQVDEHDCSECAVMAKVAGLSGKHIFQSLAQFERAKKERDNGNK